MRPEDYIGTLAEELANDAGHLLGRSISAQRADERPFGHDLAVHDHSVAIADQRLHRFRCHARIVPQNGNGRRSGSTQLRRAVTENSTGFDQ